jgi:hypothetical protein
MKLRYAYGLRPFALVVSIILPEGQSFCSVWSCWQNNLGKAIDGLMEDTTMGNTI